MILYKYRNWRTDFHKEILTKNELFYASPAMVNDPFDMIITSDFSILTDGPELEKLIDDLMNKEGIPNNPISRQQAKYTFKKYQKTLQKEWNDSDEKMTGQRFGLISLTPIWDSVLMWSHYANNHKGFCVGLHKERLLENIPVGASGPVTYINNFPQIPPLKFDAESLVAKTHMKSESWKYEKEYRFAQYWPDMIPGLQDRKVNFSDDVYAEIILGILISKEDRRNILEIASLKAISVYQLQKRPQSFLLEREKIL